MSELRHIGHDAKSKRKYVVVFRQLPEDANSALVVETEEGEGEEGEEGAEEGSEGTPKESESAEGKESSEAKED